MTAWAYLDHPGPIAFAHRGGASDRPENTMGAFAHAIELGYRYLETDVHVTADGYLVAFHDDVLDRVTDGTGRIADLAWSQVRRARIGDEMIPLLSELLDAWPDARVNIDAKHDAALEPLAQVLTDHKATDRVCVNAFTDRRLVAFRRLTAGRVCTGMGTSGITRLKAAGIGLPVGRIPGWCAQVPVKHGRFVVLDRRFVAAAHRRGLPVHVWTIDEPGEMERLLDLGVDGIMTDRPAVLKEVLLRRGQWT